MKYYNCIIIGSIKTQGGFTIGHEELGVTAIVKWNELSVNSWRTREEAKKEADKIVNALNYYGKKVV